MGTVVLFKGLWRVFIHFLQCSQIKTLQLRRRRKREGAARHIPVRILPKNNINHKKETIFRNVHFLSRCSFGGASVRESRGRQSSHHARFDVLAHALWVVVVVVVVVGAAGRGVEGRDAVEVEHEVFSVAHGRVALVARDAHCGREERTSRTQPSCAFKDSDY